MHRTAGQTDCLALSSTQWLVDTDPLAKGTDVQGKASDECQQGARPKSCARRDETDRGAHRKMGVRGEEIEDRGPVWRFTVY